MKNQTTKELEASIQLELTKKELERKQLVLETIYKFMCNFLDSEEARFINNKEFDSPEDCINYIDAANYAEGMGRVNHCIKSAEEWLNKEPIEQGPERSDYIFKSLSDIVRPI